MDYEVCMPLVGLDFPTFRCTPHHPFQEPGFSSLFDGLPVDGLGGRL